MRAVASDLAAADQPGTVLLVAAFDSQLKWCMVLARAFLDRGFSCRVVVPDVRSALSARQLADLGVEEVEHVRWDDLLELAEQHAVVVLGLNGPAVRRFLVDLSDRAPQAGPVVIAGWVGIIIEKHAAGYLERCGADVVIANSTIDADYFRRLAAQLSLPSANLLPAGLPFLSGRAQPQESGPISTLLYADQPTVPRSRAERQYVYRRLVGYAEAHPDRTVLLKPRHQLGEDTFHRMKHHPEDLLSGLEVPANLQIVHTPIQELLGSADLLVTFSSTACLEAIDRGRRVALVLDLGVHEQYGNQALVDSGLLRTFDQITADDIGRPRADWVAAYFGADDRPAVQVVDRVEKLLASGERPSRGVWESAYFESLATVSQLERGDGSASASVTHARTTLARFRHGVRAAVRTLRSRLPG